jgi:hypothetical protein
MSWHKQPPPWHSLQSSNYRLLPQRSKWDVLHNFLTLWKILNNLTQIITIVSLCAYDMHDTTSRSWLVKGEKVHIRDCGRGFSCPSDCLVSISNRISSCSKLSWSNTWSNLRHPTIRICLISYSKIWIS